MNPNRKVEVYPGEWRPECFGHTGYGDGFQYPGRCDVRICSSGGYCYAKLRDEVEGRDPEAAAEYERRRQVLREEGLDSMTIVRLLAAQGYPPTTLDAVLENTRRGQIASGHWHECATDHCVTLVVNSRQFCREHEPKEDEDGEPRDSGKEPGARASGASVQP